MKTAPILEQMNTVNFITPLTFGLKTTGLLNNIWRTLIDISQADELSKVHQENVMVTLKNGILNSLGECKPETEDRKKGYHCEESFSGAFKSCFTLAESITPKLDSVVFQDIGRKVHLLKSESSHQQANEVEISSEVKS